MSLEFPIVDAHEMGRRSIRTDIAVSKGDVSIVVIVVVVVIAH